MIGNYFDWKIWFSKEGEMCIPLLSTLLIRKHSTYSRLPQLVSPAATQQLLLNRTDLNSIHGKWMEHFMNGLVTEVSIDRFCQFHLNQAMAIDLYRYIKYIFSFIKWRKMLIDLYVNRRLQIAAWQVHLVQMKRKLTFI